MKLILTIIFGIPVAAGLYMLLMFTVTILAMLFD